MEPDELSGETGTRALAERGHGGWVRAAFGVLLPVLVIGAGIIVAVIFYKTRPEVKRKKPRKTTTLVRLMSARRSNEQVVLRTMGLVIPSKRIILQPRVSGEIVSVVPDFVEGGTLDKGQLILQLDKRDYELAVEQRRSDVARAEHELKLEEGQQVIAKSEWDATGEGTRSEANADLILRKSYLKRARAALAAARSSLERARLDLGRTSIKAPFNAVVQSKHVDIGTQASQQTQLAALVGTDEYWVRVSVPVDRLGWITVPSVHGEKGSMARVVHAVGVEKPIERPGSVVRMLGELEPEGRMAGVLVSVKDPLGLKGGGEAPPLLIGAYVRVEIAGRELRDVFAIPRSALRDGSSVWIMGDDDALEIRAVDVVWRGRDRLFIRNSLKDGDRIVLSNIAAPVAGIPLRDEAAKASASSDAPPEGGRP